MDGVSFVIELVLSSFVVAVGLMLLCSDCPQPTRAKADTTDAIARIANVFIF